ncbi:MAG: hypothetical protein SAK29_09500 [Scytonema sp. PMC 1069.18]|nr:hypothetical protein [Scytonema sp. PMC 1069.18]MEC4881963.1 hypothetical protein [Scytonema sp. PMC 1070.18]
MISLYWIQVRSAINDTTLADLLLIESDRIWVYSSLGNTFANLRG